jgi:D-glucuronyl C5-epimerase-like protein
MRLRRSTCCAFVTILCSLFPVAEASAAKKTTVTRALQDLVSAGTLTPENAAAHRATYRDAKATIKKLVGTRKAELNGVVADLDDMANRRQLTASRVPALFLTLERNLQYWKSGPLLGYNQRVSFPDSELVFQHYAGHGIQIQWLGTFGKLNGYWSGGKRYDTRAGTLLDEILPLATGRAGGLAWEYLFPFDGQKPPWVSSLAQGTGLQAMARVAYRLNRQADVIPVVGQGLGIFQTAPPAGVRVAADGGAHYLQYSGLPKLQIINGFVQSLVGLFDYAQLTGDTVAQTLFQQGDTAARKEVPRFDTGAWSLYSRSGSSRPESDLGYHQLLRDFLNQLCKRTQENAYCSTASRFTGYLKTAPVLSVLSSNLRAGKTGKLRFKLDKISRVSVKVVGPDGRVVDSRGLGTVGRGSRWIEFKPKHSGTYTVTLNATDLAGNAGDASGSVEVKRKK